MRIVLKNKDIQMVDYLLLRSNEILDIKNISYFFQRKSNLECVVIFHPLAQILIDSPLYGITQLKNCSPLSDCK